MNNETNPIVVGGRYVVSENPTDSFGMGPEGLRYLAVDRVVNVEDIDDLGRGACCYDEDSGHFVGYVDPRHLTPAPEPAAAPAVDDDLLTAIRNAIGYWFNAAWVPDIQTKHFMASEPMQRLRAAWTAAEAAKYAESLRHQDAAYSNLERQRDEARAERDDLRSQLEAESTVQWAHRDTIEHLTAEAEQAKRDLQRVQFERDAAYQEAADARDRITERERILQAERDDARVEVEHLRTVNAELSLDREVERRRAAHCICGPASVISDGPNVDCPEHGQPALPQVHTAERRGDYVYVNLGHNCGVYETREGAADMAALGLAALGVFDAEAADTSSDDERGTPTWDDVREAHRRGFDAAMRSSRGEAALSDAQHRARGGQEAGL